MSKHTNNVFPFLPAGGSFEPLFERTIVASPRDPTSGDPGYLVFLRFLALLSLLHIRNVHVEHRAGGQNGNTAVIGRYYYDCQVCDYGRLDLPGVRLWHVLLFGQFIY